MSESRRRCRLLVPKITAPCCAVISTASAGTPAIPVAADCKVGSCVLKLKLVGAEKTV